MMPEMEKDTLVLDDISADSADRECGKDLSAGPGRGAERKRPPPGSGV
jgi:hypothetical protein